MMTYRPAILRPAVFAITLLVFARLTTCSFTWWDDHATIHQNPRLNPPTWNTLAYYWTTADEQATMALYVPVTYTVWAALAKIGHLDHPDAEGLNLSAAVFHSANVLIHALTAVVVFQLLLRLFGNDLAAFCGALLFALHPVQVESVGWISGTKDLLCGLLSSSALLMYVRSVQIKLMNPKGWWPSRWRYLLGLLFFVLAMLSKPTAVVVPLMAAVIALLFLNRSVRQTILSLFPWFVLMIPFLYWTRKYQPAPWADPLPVWARPAVALDAITFYFYKLIWPIHLCIDYGHNPKTIAANHTIYFTWIVPIAAAAVLWWRYERCRPMVAAALLFLMPLLPVLGLVPFEFQMVSTTADHYLYLPMVGAGALLAWTITRSKIPITAVFVLLIALATRTILQEPVWQNSRSLFHHALAVNPNSIEACDNLGFVTGRDARRLIDAGRAADAHPLFDESIDWYRRSLARENTNVPSMYNLALDYQMIGRTGLGLEQIHKIVQLQPELPEGLKMDPPVRLAQILVDFGDLPGAAAWLDQVIRENPNNLAAMQWRIRVDQMMQHPATRPS